MASCTRNARFELRRNSSSNWTNVNPKLLSGEPGVEIESGQMKIGDGVRNWNSLPYVGISAMGPTGETGPTGGQGEFITTLEVTAFPAAVLTPTSFVLSGTGGRIQSQEAYVLNINSIFIKIRNRPIIPNVGDKIHIGIFSSSIPDSYYLAFTNVGGIQKAELFNNNTTTGFVITGINLELMLYANGINLYVMAEGVPEYSIPLLGEPLQEFAFFAEAITLTSPVTYPLIKFFPTDNAGVTGPTGPSISGSSGPVGVLSPDCFPVYYNSTSGQLFYLTP